MNKAIAITGIHTDIGKTVVSAVIAEALGADYWKPVQAGSLEHSDRMVVEELLTNGKNRVHKEAIVLTAAMSPHAAAKLDAVQIDHRNFSWPSTDKILIVETAGGVLSPMYDNVTMADFVKDHALPTILVSQNYLGSINHTLLSIEVLKAWDIPIIGIVMNGEPNTETENFIEKYSGVPILTRVPFFTKLNQQSVHACGIKIRDALKQIVHVDKATR